MTSGETPSGPPVSAKAAGKRRALNEDTPASTAAPTPSSKSGVQTRQKRVLPSRSRRGGPGVGGCDVDVMILETRKRRFDSEPLIPASTMFFLTTKSALIPTPSQDDTSPFALNIHAFGRYFDRPEVQQACKYQQIIQTPEFTQLPDDALVGGRFRPRGSEEEAADTSDAAYEKRHRKYETFEKRQRLREKEKLKHEQYKLKERIEQLRAMDTSAFLALPATKFSDPPGTAHEGDYDQEDTGLNELPGAHVNGAAAYNEGERRRAEMLEIAHVLEDRYRVLLPPDRKWQEKKEKAEKARRETLNASYSVEQVAESEPEPEPDQESLVEEDELAAEDEPETPAPPEPEPEISSRNTSDGESEVDFEARDKERSKLKLRIRFPPRQTNASAPAGPALIIPPSKKAIKMKKIQTKLAFLSASAPPPQKSPTKPKAGPSGRRPGRPPGRKRLLEAGADMGETTSIGPPKKRQRNGDSHTYSPAPSRQSHTGSSKVPCALMVSALRTAAAPSARKTQRHVTAFGVRVPQELEEVHDYGLPSWVTSDEPDETEFGWDGGDYEDRYHDGTESEAGSAAASDRWQHDVPSIATLDVD